MTTIRFTEEDGECRLTVEGHAGYAEEGQDIVCAGISTLVCTLHDCLSTEYERDHLTRYEADIDAGNARFCWVVNPEYKRRVQYIWETVEAGLVLIAGHYPANVVMEE